MSTSHSHDEAMNWLKLKLREGVAAEAFVDQLAIGFANRQCLELSDYRFYLDPFPILDEVEKLEKGTGQSHTKAPAQFRYSQLKGLWKKHWFQASFMSMNLVLENERVRVHQIVGALKRSFPDRKYLGKHFDELQANSIAYSMVVEAYADRARRRSNGYGHLTGEWIVYAHLGGRNYYLTLAHHEEDDFVILNRCLPALAQFPEIQDLPAFSFVNVLGACREAFRRTP
jgi:hypothetical protein